MCNMIWTLIFWFLSNFLRILNYSQSFQEQVVMFSSVIILSEKKTLNIAVFTYFDIFLSIIYLIWSTVRYTYTQWGKLCNVTRSTKLRGTQHSPELALSSTDFCSPENLIFPALKTQFKIEFLLLLSCIKNGLKKTLTVDMSSGMPKRSLVMTLLSAYYNQALKFNLPVHKSFQNHNNSLY